MDGVWASAAANMRTYLLLKERAAAYRADPEVPRRCAAAGVADARRAHPDAGRDARRPARRPLAPSRTSTPTPPAERGFGFVRLNQLAIEHLLGAR